MIELIMSKITDCTVDNCEGMDKFLKQLGKKNADDENRKKTKPFELKNISDLQLREMTTQIIDISMKYGDDCSYEKTNFMCPFKRLLQFLINQADNRT